MEETRTHNNVQRHLMVLLLAVSLGILLSALGWAASVGPSTATLANNDANWTDWGTSQLQSKDGSTYANTTTNAVATGTLSGFTFSVIPEGSLIDGIVVTITAKETHVGVDGYYIR